MNYGALFAFKDFILERKPEIWIFRYRYDGETANSMDKDYFTLMQFFLNGILPSMLCQNHTQLVKGGLGRLIHTH
jgi:hypothetical protein